MQDSCDGISYQGCCEGPFVKYCEGGTLLQRNCGTPDNCGWDDQANRYDCDQTGSGPPEFPLACGANPNTCDGIPTTGECNGNTLRVCTSDDNLHEQECSECCGWLEAAGYFDCLTGVACESVGGDGSGPADAGPGNGSGSSGGCSAAPNGNSQPVSPLFILVLGLFVCRLKRRRSPDFRQLS